MQARPRGNRYHQMEARTRKWPKGPDATARAAEIVLILAGFLVLLLAFLSLRVTDGEGPVSTALGWVGLGLLALAGLGWTLRSFRAGGQARLPTTVGRTQLSPGGGLRCWMALTLALAVGIPIAAAVVLSALADDGWVWIAMGLFIGGTAVLVERSVGRRAQRPLPMTSGEPIRLLERLCMRADMPVPALEMDPTRVPIAWTAGGRIRLSEPLLRSLDRAELEAVLAHELAHLAHRDAAVMDLVTAPSRLLLGIVTACLRPGRVMEVSLSERLGLLMFGLVYVPPAFVLGWGSRLLGLGLSRAREHSADAAAAILTGHPSALASALLKLDAALPKIPRRDLRGLRGRRQLCIVDVRPARFGPLLRTHPATAKRVARLERMEARLQLGQ
jgi:heat shock protein HtpX